MKKALSLTLAAILLIALGSAPALAAQPTKSASHVIVEYNAPDPPSPNESSVFDGAGSGAMRGASPSDYDLGTNGSLSMTITNFAPSSIRQSDYNYKTNSTKIKITMKSNIAISVRVTLYDASNDSQVQQTTVVVGTSNTAVTFTNLTYSKKYYIQYENLNQQQVNITGTISAT